MEGVADGVLVGFGLAVELGVVGATLLLGVACGVDDDEHAVMLGSTTAVRSATIRLSRRMLALLRRPSGARPQRPPHRGLAAERRRSRASSGTSAHWRTGVRRPSPTGRCGRSPG